MTDIRLDAAGDLYVSDVGGTALETGYAAGVRQRLMIRLQLFAGEWFLDTRLGVPYFRDVLVKNPNMPVIRALLRGKILADTDVVAVPSLEMTLAGRTLSVTAEVLLKDGSPLSVTYPPAAVTTPWADAPRLPGGNTSAQPDADAVTPWSVDLRLSPTHDLYVSDVGDTGLIVSLADAVRQRTAIRLQLFLGEWFLNTRLGVPYFRDVFVKNPDFAVIRDLIRSRVSADPDVVAVPTVSFEHDTLARLLTITLEAVISDGTTITVSTDTLPDGLITTLLGDPIVTLGGDYVVTL